MRTIWLWIILLLMGLTTLPAFAFNSGSTEVLGAFNPTTNTTVQLPADGILNYTTVNIPSGVTVTFLSNAANTPVYMLATGDVTISGTISVNGGNGSGLYPGKGGAGGYNGGYGGVVGAYGSYGLGPNGGSGGAGWTYFGPWYYCYFGYGGYGGSISANDKIAPSIGGSGGGGGDGGNSSDIGGGGGGGGGALLIASSGKVTVTGTVVANGGAGAPAGNVSTYCQGSGGGGGSGGTIRIIANEIAGNGTIQATGGSGGSANNTLGTASIGGAGSNGKIRLEATTLSRTYPTNPVYIYDYPGQVFNITMPVLQITSVGGTNVPSNPSGNYANTDIVLSGSANSVSVVVTASNIPPGTTVTIKAIPQFASATSATATLQGTNDLSSATTTMSLSSTRPSVLIATATYTITVASNSAPLYADGELITKMKVESALNGNSSITYITESGREILAINK